MLTIYWSSIWIGLVIGAALGIAISMFATWATERTMFKESGSDFSNGFNRGWECGIEHQKLLDGKSDPK